MVHTQNRHTDTMSPMMNPQTRGILKHFCTLYYPRHLLQVLAENIYHQQYHNHKVSNNSSYNLGLIMPSSLMIMSSDKFSWSHVDLRTDPIHSLM